MAQTRTGTLRFKAPTGEVVERPQEEVQSLRRAGYTPEPGQTLLLRARGGGVREVPVENLASVSPDTEIAIPTRDIAFREVAKERYGGLGGAAKAFGYGGAQGYTSGLAGAGMIESGLAEPESLAMLRSAQPLATFLGEGVGMVGQGLTLGGLGALARGAGAAGKAAQAAEVAAPTLRQAVARGAAREAAAGAAYGAGSEITEAKIEGREARPLEAAAEVGAVGGAFGAAMPLLARGAGVLKGAAQKLRAEKIAESETLREAAIAKAEQKLANARTAEQRDAARQEIRTLREAEKAAAKAREAGIKEQVEEKLDDAAIDAGQEAQRKLDDYRKLRTEEVQRNVAGIDDAVQAINATNEEVEAMGLGKSLGRARQKLESRIRSLASDVSRIGADIDAGESVITNIEALGLASKEVLSAKAAATELANVEKGRVARAAEELRLAERSGARAEEIAKLQNKLRAAELSQKVYSDHLNAIDEIAAATSDFSQGVRVSERLGREVGAFEAEGARAARGAEAAERKLERIIPDELKVTSEAAAAGEALSESLAKRMGLAPAIGEIVPEVGAQSRAFGAGIGRVMTKASTERMLLSAARTGGEEFIDTLLKLSQTGMRKPAGLAIPTEFVGSAPSHVLGWLHDNPAAIRALDPLQRSRVLADVVSKIGGESSKMSAMKDAVTRALKSKAAVAALEVPEAEVSAALMRSQKAPAAAMPEAMFSAQKAANRASIEGEKAVLATVQSSAEAMAAKVRAEKAVIDKSLADAAKDLAQKREQLAAAKYEKTMVPRAQEVENLSQQIDRLQARSESLGALETKLTSAKTVGAGEQWTMDQLAAEARENLLAAQNELQISRAQRQVGVAAAKKAGLEAEKQAAEDQLKKLIGGDGIIGLEQVRRDAIGVIEQFRSFAGDLGKIEKNAITGRYYAPGEAEIVERSMKQYMSTPEGKKLAAQLAAAEKAAASKVERQVEREVRAAAGVPEAGAAPSTKQVLKDAITDPATLAAAAVGGPGAGFAAALMTAARSSKSGIRQMLTSMSPMFFYTSLENAATVAQRMASAPLAKAASIYQADKTQPVTRREVNEANDAVDSLLRDQQDAKNAFALAARSTSVPGDKFGELEKRYDQAVDMLQRMRPKTAGLGPVTAEQEEFVRAYKMITDPGALAQAFRTGSLTAKQAQLLNTMSPEAYAALDNMVKVVHAERPQALPPRLRMAFGVKTSMSAPGTEGLSVGEAMQTMGAGHAQQEEQQRGGTLATRTPGTRSSLAENASFSTRVGGGAR